MLEPTAQVFDAALAARLVRLYARPQIVGQHRRLRELIAARPGETGADGGIRRHEHESP